MKNIFVTCCCLLAFWPMSLFAQQPVNWEPQINQNNENCTVSFQHINPNLKYYLVHEDVTINGNRTKTIVVRFATNINLPGVTVSSVNGTLVSPNVYQYNKQLNLGPSATYDAIQAEVYENSYTAGGKPIGKGTLVAQRSDNDTLPPSKVERKEKKTVNGEKVKKPKKVKKEKKIKSENVS